MTKSSLKQNHIMGSGVQATLLGEEAHIRIIRQAVFGSKASSDGFVRLWRSVYRPSVRIIDVAAANSSSHS